MKLKEGMYVRTKVGKIAKIINKYDNSGSLHKENFVWVLDDCSVLALHSQKVTKASHNLLALIEKDDFINGKRVVNIVHFEGDEFYRIELFGGKAIMNIKDIESVVTKEQFESMSYKIEE